jgi:hypothetical protein
MAQGSFAAQVSDWVRETKGAAREVYRESAQRVVETMQVPRAMGGNMRVDTGFLRASLVATTTGMLPPLQDKPDGVAAFAYDAGQINLVINGADITDTITVAYTANYARPREYGARGQPGDRFVALAAQQWQRIVSEVATEAQARAGG